MGITNYISIDVVDTAALCNLDIKQSTVTREEVQARCPFCGDYKYRMYLSHRMDNATYWCHNCGATGNAVIITKSIYLTKAILQYNPSKQKQHKKEVVAGDFSLAATLFLLATFILIYYS